jgi:hypothetical protein
MQDTERDAPQTMSDAFDQGVEELDQAAAPSPQGTGGTTPAAPTPEEPPVSDQPATTGQPRDQSGRFAPKSSESPAPVEESPAAAPASPEPEPAEVDLSAFKPFAFKAGGQEVPLEGSAVSDTGAWFPAPLLPKLSQLLSQGAQAPDLGRHYAQLRQQDRQTHQQALDAKTAELTAAQELIGEFDNLRKQAASDPEAVLAFLMDERGWQLWQSKAQQKIQEAKLASFTQREQERQREGERERQLPLMQADFSRTLDGVLQQAQAQGIALDRAKLEQKLLPSWEMMFRPATEQDVQRGFTGRVGETLFDSGPIYREVQWAMELAKSYQPKPQPKVVKTNALPPSAKTNAPGPQTPGAKKDPKHYGSASEAFESAFADT